MQRQQTGGRLKGFLFLAIALGAAGGTAYLVFEVLKRADERATRGALIEKQTVVVAKNDLIIGLPITEDDVATLEVLPESVPLDRVYDRAEVLVGQTPRERIYAGEVIRMERLARRDAGVGLNAIISPGKRAMTIETDTESSLAGFLKPGNWVDVIVTIRPDDKDIAARWVTETILQDVRVLGVGDSLGETEAAPTGDKKAKKERAGRTRTRPSVTLELTPEESERLALAVSKGDLHLVLRSDIDKVTSEAGQPLNTTSMLGMVAPPPPPPTAAASRSGGGSTTPATTNPSYSTAEVIEGSQSTSVKLNASGEVVEGTEDRRRR